jgi:hypothetical protein
LVEIIDKIVASLKGPPSCAGCGKPIKQIYLELNSYLLGVHLSIHLRWNGSKYKLLERTASYSHLPSVESRIVHSECFSVVQLETVAPLIEKWLHYLDLEDVHV